jgi:predicted DNA-binding transcriptional regulator YafY
VLAACCRDSEILSFDYRDRAGEARPRRVEPHHLVVHPGRWYLVAFDSERSDWRTLRIDRMAALRPTRRSFDPRALPDPDPATCLVRSFAAATYRHSARVAVGWSADAVRARVFGSIPGDVDASGRTQARCG